MSIYSIYDKIRDFEERIQALDSKVQQLSAEISELAAGLKHFAHHDVLDHELAEQLLERFNLVD